MKPRITKNREGSYLSKWRPWVVNFPDAVGWPSIEHCKTWEGAMLRANDYRVLVGQDCYAKAGR